MTAILFAAGVPVAAAHDDDDNPAAAGEPLGLRDKGPGRDFGMLLRLARGAMGDDNERMFAGKVGVDEQGIEAGGSGLHPGDEQLALDIVRRCDGLSFDAQEREKEKQTPPGSHRRTLQRVRFAEWGRALGGFFVDGWGGFAGAGGLVAGEDGDDLGEGDEEGRWGCRPDTEFIGDAVGGFFALDPDAGRFYADEGNGFELVVILTPIEELGAKDDDLAVNQFGELHIHAYADARLRGGVV